MDPAAAADVLLRGWGALDSSHTLGSITVPSSSLRLIVLALVLPVLPELAPPGRAASIGLVVPKVYGGGGNSGASYAADLAGLSQEYRSVSGSSSATVALSGSVPGGGRHLVLMSAAGPNRASARSP